MMLKIFERIAKMFGKKPDFSIYEKIPAGILTSPEEIDVLHRHFPVDKNAYAKSIAYDEFPDPVITMGNTPTDKILLVVDDLPLTEIILDAAFANIRKDGHSVYDDFNVITCYNEHANFSMIKYVNGHTRLPELKITHALLDLTLEHEVKLFDGQICRYDGIALYDILQKKYPGIKVRFFSAHSIPVHPDKISDESSSTNSYRPMSYLKDGINAYIEKFAAITNGNTALAAYCISKSDPDSYKKIEEFLYES